MVPKLPVETRNLQSQNAKTTELHVLLIKPVVFFMVSTTHMSSDVEIVHRLEIPQTLSTDACAAKTLA